MFVHATHHLGLYKLQEYNLPTAMPVDNLHEPTQTNSTSYQQPIRQSQCWGGGHVQALQQKPPCHVIPKQTFQEAAWRGWWQAICSCCRSQNEVCCSLAQVMEVFVRGEGRKQNWAHLCSSLMGGELSRGSQRYQRQFDACRG